jgi:chorismate synthase
VPAIKGVEFGDGFALAAMKGTATRGRMGGLTGGLTDGDALIVRAAMKPIPTTRTPQPTYDLATGQPAETVYERSDVCPVPRAVVVIEAAVCTVLADALLEKTGGDSLDEVTVRVAALPKTQVLSSESKMFWP